MEKHRCKLCFKSFSNGRALGGHMRSHMATLSIPPKTQQFHKLQNDSDSASSSSSSSSSSGEDDEEKSLFYELRENPKKSFRIVDPEFSVPVDAESIVQDRESETESSRNPSRKRSKRNRKSSPAESPAEPEPVSSVSDTTPEEDVALCLMMLSRDIWMRDEEEEEEEEKFCKTRTGAKYKCSTCKKVFRSYQALGGHRASHKKIKSCIPFSSHEAESEPGNANVAKVDRRIHECPVCFRVFGSGQALGGHKRSHLSGSGSGSASAANSTQFEEKLIDLNLPAPVNDDDMSQIELSAVSDAEFVDPIK